MRRVAQVGWAVLAAALLAALTGGVLWLAGAGQVGRVLCVAGVGCGALGSLVGVLAEQRAAARRLAAKGPRGHLAVRDCVRDMASGEPMVHLVADLHLPGHPPVPMRIRAALAETDIAWLTDADEVPCRANPADPYRVWLMLPDENERRGKLVRVRGEDLTPRDFRRGFSPSR